MTSTRTLLNRVARLEHARRPRKSCIALAYGSFEAFASQVRQEVGEGKLDRIDMLGVSGEGGVLRCLRRWEREGLI